MPQGYGQPPQAGSNTGIIIGVVVVLLIILLVIIFAVVGSSPTVPTATALPPPPPPPAGRTYTFYPGKDSGGSDIKQFADLADNPAGLKLACDGLSGCKGFNTNGHMKSAVAPQSSWLTWTTDPDKGFYNLAEQFEQHVNWM